MKPLKLDADDQITVMAVIVGAIESAGFPTSDGRYVHLKKTKDGSLKITVEKE